MSEQIQLAVNYSPESEQLMLDGRISFDLFKLPDWPDLVEQVIKKYPVYIHFTLTAGLGEVVNADWQMIFRLMEQTGTPRVNLHLVSPQGMDYRDPRAVEQIVQSAIGDIRIAAEKVGMDQVILENAPIAESGEDFLLPVVAPEMIARIVRETGCGFLLDLAHAMLVARVLGIDERGYLSILPVEKLIEMHVTGIGPHEGVWVDHMPMQKQDWALLDWSLDQIRQGRWARPSVIALEYGGIGEIFRWRSHLDVLAAQVPELKSKIL